MYEYCTGPVFVHLLTPYLSNYLRGKYPVDTDNWVHKPSNGAEVTLGNYSEPVGE